MTHASAISEPPAASIEAPRLDNAAPPAVEPTSLRASFQWSLVGSVFYAACQWAVLIALAKLGSTEAVGQFALGLALTAPVVLFANLQLSALQATDARREFRFGHYLALRLLTTILALGVIAGLAFGLGYHPVTTAVVLAVGIAKVFEAISDVYHGLLQQHHRMERVAWSLMLRGSLSVVAVVLGLWLTGSVIVAAIALAATWGALMVAYDLQSVAWLRALDADAQTESALPCWDWAALGRLAWQAFPIGVRVMLFTLCLNVPRYFIEEYHGEQALGLFAAMAYVAVVAQVVSNAIGQAAAPKLGSHYAAGDMPGFRSLTLKLAAAAGLVGGAGMLVAWLGGRPLLALLYSAEYAAHVDVFTWIMAASGLWCVASMFVVAANAGRRQTTQAIAGIGVVAVTVAASVLLIREDALYGAALASVAGSTAALIAFAGIFLTIAAPADSEVADSTQTAPDLPEAV